MKKKKQTTPPAVYSPSKWWIGMQPWAGDYKPAAKAPEAKAATA